MKRKRIYGFDMVGLQFFFQPINKLKTPRTSFLLTIKNADDTNRMPRVFAHLM
jgi:hypothetical protein